MDKTNATRAAEEGERAPDADMAARDIWQNLRLCRDGEETAVIRKALLVFAAGYRRAPAVTAAREVAATLLAGMKGCGFDPCKSAPCACLDDIAAALTTASPPVTEDAKQAARNLVKLLGENGADFLSETNAEEPIADALVAFAAASLGGHEK